MHFGHPLAPFWIPLAPFWLSFGSLLVPFGTLWLTPKLYFLILGVSQRHFYILLYFPCKSYRRQGCSCNFLSKYKFLCTRTRKTAAAYRMRCLARWRERGFAALKIRQTVAEIESNPSKSLWSDTLKISEIDQNGAPEHLESNQRSKRAPGWVLESKSYAFLAPDGCIWVPLLSKMGAAGVPN